MKSSLYLWFLLVGIGSVHGAEPASPPSASPLCIQVVDDFFLHEVWAKVAAQKCLTCHQKGGDAEESRLLLLDPRKSSGVELAGVLRHNREAFTTIAKRKQLNDSLLLQKVVGNLEHGGGKVLAPESAGLAILTRFVTRVQHAQSASPSTPDPTIESKPAPFFANVEMMEPRLLLRRVSLSLVGRLPTPQERTAIERGGSQALPAILDAMMKEEAFYTRLREGFNDIFLTLGLDGASEATILSYDHFNKTRLWYQKYDLSAAGDAKAQQQARYKLANDYRQALLGEPMKLIEYIVRHDRPFTEIVTADYIMVTPYSARGYGIYDDIKSQFKNPDDPFEYIPVKLKALVGRNAADNQESTTGFYPHAGILSTFQYLTRYPTTETNRNRLRARMYYQHFLGVDVLELAARVSDSAAVTAKYKIPTMQASECVVCHRTLDPVASLFQDYWKFADLGVYGRRKGGWFTDMFGAGFEGTPMPEAERWRALQWLGENTARDPRFAATMVEHVYYILTGRKALLPPKDLDDPMYSARYRAYQEQHCVVEAIAARFVQSGFNLKVVFQEWIASDFYRAAGLSTEIADPKRRAELEDIGIVRMLSPEQLDRKVKAVFGQPWKRLEGREEIMLYGGIDSKEVTERAADPSGVMGALQRSLSNDVACKNVALDFARPPAERRLFPDLEPDVLPNQTKENDAKIRCTIQHLHETILGRHDAADSEEVNRTFNLFAGIVKDAQRRKNVDTSEIYHCRQGGALSKDPHYTIRAWRSVVTYLLRRPEFLYE